MSADLSTNYLGMSLRTPLVASAGPLTGHVDTAKALVDAGASAVVLPSLFEEEILAEETQLNAALEFGAGVNAEAQTYFPDEIWSDYESPRERYLAHLGAVKEAVDVPVIASLNAVHRGAWEAMARELQDGGADALELNLYHVATDPDRSAHDVESEDIAMVAQVAAALSIPVAVKLSPYYSSIAHVARQFAGAGAAGLVCFNRFYQPDLDPDTREVEPHLQLSAPWEIRLPMRWIALLRPLLPDTSLALTTGVTTGRDAAKALLVGADVVMMTSALLQYGPAQIGRVEAELQTWADEHEYDSVDQLRGSVSHATTEQPEAFERANYLKVLRSWATTVQPGV